jgi:hypothetical protein
MNECFRIAGSTVQVDWCDPAVRESLRAALVHRTASAVPPDLVISASRSPTASEPAAASGLFMSDLPEGLEVDEPERGLLHRLDVAAGRAAFACREPRLLPISERAAPFRLILQRWLRTRDVHLLHAGAVGLPGGDAVLLAAPGGGGKSNTVLSCLAYSSLQVVGEDFIAVDAGARPRVWSLYGSAKLHAADLARFPTLAAEISAGHDASDGKVVLDLSQQHRERMDDGLPLRAILVLKITGAAGSQVIPATPGVAVKALLTSLLMVLPSARRPLFEFTTELARKLPAYRLELGRDPAQVAGAIQEFLQRAP